MAVGSPTSPRPVNEIQAAYYDLDRQRKVLDKLPLDSTKYKQEKRSLMIYKAKLELLSQKHKQRKILRLQKKERNFKML